MVDRPKNIDLLRDVALFADLSEDELVRIAERCGSVRLNRLETRRDDP
jgi:hypothetical protein